MTSTSAGPSWAKRAAMRVVEVARVARPGGRAPRTAGVGGEVGVVQGGLPHVEVLGPLLLGDLAEHRVVDEHVGDVHPVLHGGGQLGRGTGRSHRRRSPRRSAGRARRPTRPWRRGTRSRSSRGSPTSAPTARCTRSTDRTSTRCCRRRLRSTASSGNMAGHGREDRGRAHTRASVVGQPPLLLGPPDRPPLGDVGPLVDRLRRRRQRLREQSRSDTDVAEHRHGHRMEATERHGIEVDLHDRLVVGDARVIRERRAEHQQQIGFVHHPAGHGRAAAARARHTRADGDRRSGPSP